MYVYYIVSYLHCIMQCAGWSTCLHCTAQHHCSASTSSSYLPPTCYRWGGAAQRHHQPPSCHHPGHNNKQSGEQDSSMPMVNTEGKVCVASGVGAHQVQTPQARKFQDMP